MEFERLIFLPVETLTVMASGYLGYRLAFTGLDQRHKSLDVLLISLVFALVARLGFAASDVWLKDFGLPVSVPLSFVLTLFLAGFWRYFLSDYIFLFFRHLKISHSDNLGSAWDRLIVDTKHQPFRLVVKTINGAEYLTDLAKHNNKPFGACYLGSDGDLGIYVDYFRCTDGSEWLDYENAPDKDYGVLTYLPSEQITRTDFYYNV